MRRELGLRAFRMVARLSLLLSIGSVVWGIYLLLERVWGFGLVLVGAGVLLLVPSQYFRIRPDPEAENLLVLVTKQDCSLCDEARHVIRNVTQGTPFTLQEVDIADHGHLRRFKNIIPVLFWQGDEIARLKVDPDQLRTRIDAILQEREARAKHTAATA